MERLDINKLREDFNRASGSVRLVAILSPTWPVCQYGQGAVRGLFEEFDGEHLRGFITWLPMMPGDNGQFADQEAATFEGFRLDHAWDQERELGNLYARTLNLTSVAWDVYFLYAPGIAWEGDEPPQPTFWMHQLPAETGASRDLVLYPTRLSQEILNLLGSGVEPGHTSRADLGLQLHAKGLSNLLKERSQYSLEEIRQVVTDSKIEAWGERAMPVSIAREEVQRLVTDEDALVIEVLPAAEYQDEHIDGAINIPLKTLDRESTSGLDRARPLIVYWHDAAWDMSPRAAWRLESLGFTQVYDYVGGKADWFAAGLPREGKLTSIPRTGDVARRDDVTCRPTDRISDVIDRTHAAGKETCIVTTDGGVILGRVRTDRLDGDAQVQVEEAMELGPTTTRADTTLEAILERLNARNVDSILVATSDGRLVGTLYRSDAEARLQEDRVEEAEQLIDEESCCCCKD